MVSGRKHPMVVALEPLLPLIRGDAAAAQTAALAAEDELVQTPWRETMSPLVVSEVAALQATGDDAEQRALLGRLQARFGDDLVRTAGWTPPLLALNVARAAIWAGDLDLAAECAELIVDAPLATAWAPWTRAWVDGLVAEARGELDDAARLLAAAALDPSRELPVLRAHAVADLGRVEAHRGNRAAAERHEQAADAEYRRLGATVYVQARAVPPDEPVVGDPLATLSDRERDVAILLVQGLSYAQIARDLFVTRSTVGFHLTRIYAKTGVTSRHGLTDLMRAIAAA
jgi:DNA-binding CsgD family transcriptional regulator